MSTTVIQYVLKYIQKYWLNVAKINSLEEKKQSQKKKTTTTTTTTKTESMVFQTTDKLSR